MANAQAEAVWVLSLIVSGIILKPINYIGLVKYVALIPRE